MGTFPDKQVNLDQNKSGNIKTANTKVFLLCLLVVCFLLFAALLLDYFKIISINRLFSQKTPRSQSSQSSSIVQAPNTQNSLKIIAKVGTENIYQKDLETETANFPSSAPDKDKNLLKKIINDSIILQAGQKAGLITLDDTVFNAVDKDYAKRISLVASVKRQIENKQQTISGDVVSIWFFNMQAGPAGYEKGRQIALAKIQQLHTDIVANKITMKQAAEQIKNDTELAQVDPAYKSNALLSFNAGPTDKITFDKGVETAVRNLQVNEVSTIFTVKDKDLKTGNMVDAVYMFAKVTAKNNTGSTQNFDQWLAAQGKAYEVIYY